MSGVEKETSSALKWDADQLGKWASIAVSSDVYSLTAIFKAAYWFTDRYYVYIDRPDGTKSHLVRVEIRPKSELSHEELVSTCREFANALVDHQVRQVVIAETGRVRELLVEKAFSEGRHHLDPASLISDESHTAVEGQSYSDDPLGISKATGA